MYLIIPLRNIFQPIGSSPQPMIFVQFCLPIYSPPRYNFSYWTSSWGGGRRRRREAQRNGKELCAYDIALQANEREFLAHETSPSRNISPPISTTASDQVYTLAAKCAPFALHVIKFQGERSCNRSLNRVNIQGKIWYSMRIFPDLLLLTERRRVGAFRNQVLNPRDLYSPRKKNLF